MRLAHWVGPLFALAAFALMRWGAPWVIASFYAYPRPTFPETQLGHELSSSSGYQSIFLLFLRFFGGKAEAKGLPYRVRGGTTLEAVGLRHGKFEIVWSCGACDPGL